MKTLIGVILAVLFIVLITIANLFACNNMVVATICDISVSTPSAAGQIVIDSTDYKLYVGTQTQTCDWVAQ